MSEQRAAQNTDVLLWREKDGDYYSPTISRTADGRIAINVAGTVYEYTLTEWHAIAGGPHRGLAHDADDRRLAEESARLAVLLRDLLAISPEWQEWHPAVKAARAALAAAQEEG